jgi:hypothetical protein
MYLYIIYKYMPYKTRKVRGKPCYRVTNKDNKKVFAKCTTKENAKKQMKLLRAIQFNKNFKPTGKLSVTRKNRK